MMDFVIIIAFSRKKAIFVIYILQLSIIHHMCMIFCLYSSDDLFPIFYIRMLNIML